MMARKTDAATPEPGRSYTPSDERCHVDHIGLRDLQDHLARYQFAASYAHGKRVLDIACGTGYGSAIIRQAGAAFVLGVDVSESAVGEARRAYGPDYEVGSILDYHCGTVFDLLVSFETIEHVDDYKGALNNLRRLIARDGTLILSTPNRRVNSPHLSSISDRPSNPFHVREFTTREIMQAVHDAGFTTQGVFGQRQRRLIRNRFLYGAYAVAARTGVLRGHFSAAVLPLRGALEPRYTVLVCRPTGFQTPQPEFSEP